MRTQLLRLSLWLLAAILVPGITDAKGGKKKSTPVQHAALVSEIHQTRVLLQKADHDYKGHRIKAVHELGHAMHALDPHHKHKLPPATNRGKGENQLTSDTQLAQANQRIQVIMVQLSATNVVTPHTAKAMTHLQNAVVHLNTALKIR